MSLLPTIGAIDQDTGFYNGATSTSMRFRRGVGSNTEINRDPSSAGDRKKHTLAFWVKRCKPSDGSQVILGAFASSYSDFAYFRSDDRFEYGVGNAYQVCTDMKFRDVSAWYHIVAHFDVANSTTTSRLRFWVNGVEQTKTITYGSYPADQDYAFSNTVDQTVGGLTHFSGYELDGYLCDLNFIDGSLVPYTSFGEFKNGIWIPIDIDTSAITYGTNGFRMLFNGTDTDGASTSGSVNANSVGASSVNSNHFHAYSTALANHSALSDNPENNFATMNSLLFRVSNGTQVYSEGNLKYGAPTANSWGFGITTLNVKSGKWYAELRCAGNTSVNAGVINVGHYGYHNFVSKQNPQNEAGIWQLNMDGTATKTRFNNSHVSATYTGFGNGEILGILLNADDKELSFTVDGTLQTGLGSSGVVDISTGGSANDEWGFWGNTYYGGSETLTWNFGQDSSFLGTETATSNSDANGNGTFHSAVPSGYLALCTANLEEPTIGPNSGTNEQADDYFNTVLHSGNGSTQSITGVGFQPDWVWIKERSSTSSHALYDSSRGALKQLESNTTDAETTASSMLTSFDSDGFSVGSSGAINQSSQTYVAWNWKANGGTTTTNDASATSIGSIDSVIQANTTAGFSIVTYTGTGSAGTVAHGLGAVPKMLIVRNRSEAYNWKVYHAENTSAPATDYLVLDNTDATADNVTHWADTEPTSTVFSLGTSNALIKNTNTFVAYCFAEVEGYSKFGSYTGNGNNDGTFVHLGFRPAFIMTKRTNSTSNWVIQDSVRQTFNPSDAWLRPNTSDDEGTTSPDLDLDFLSNGFKIRNNGTANNISSSTYIYMAFAVAPFKYANAR